MLVHPGNARSIQFSAILATGVILAGSGGCIVLPTPGRFERQWGTPEVHIKKVIGPADSDRPVRPGVDRAAARTTLGDPDQTLENGRLERFRYKSYNWFVFCLIPLGHFWGECSPSDAWDLRVTFNGFDQIESLDLTREP